MTPAIGVSTEDERVRLLVRMHCPELEFMPRDGALVTLVDRGDRVSQGERLAIVTDSDGTSELVASFGVQVLEQQGALIGALLTRISNEVEKNRQISLGVRIEQMLSDSDPATVWSQFAAHLREVSDAQRVSLLFQDPLLEAFTVVAGDELERGDGWIPGVPARVIRAAVTDGSQHQIFTTEDESTALLIPVSHGEEVFGFIRVEWPGEEISCRTRIARALELSARARPLLETSRELARERELAIRDDLTTAYNRRYFDRALDEEIERARRYHLPLSLIFLDLDDLKLINNRSGHLTGSRVLQEVARRILGAVRTIDRVVRFGGDEFCILLPQTDAEQARKVAERVRDAISCETILFEEMDPIELTASFGIASYPLHAQTHDGVIRAADAAMYSVKRRGKNAIATAPAPLLDEVRRV